MAQLKDSLITGDLRVTGTIYGDVPLNDLVDADDLKAIEALSGTSGLLKKTAANTWTLDTTAYKTGTVTSVRVQATSPVVSSVNTAQTSTLNTTISLADGYGDTKNPYASKTARYVLAAPASAAGAPTFRALTNADVGLGNVENTKLSTWTGSTAITTLGTITTGTIPWANISGKPSQATAWPNWSQIQQSGAENISEGSSDVTDNTEIFTSYASDNGFADTNAPGKVYRRDAIKLYNYIKGKTDSLYAPKSHTHGNIANDGALGTASRIVITDSNKKITTASYAHLNTSVGTASANGYEEFVLGNSIASGTAGNTFGRIALYSTGTTGQYIIAVGSGWKNHVLPDSAGWIATGGNGSSTGVGNATTPIYLSTSGVLTAGTALKALAYKDSLTAADVGAATAGHNHDSTYVNVTGDTMTGYLTISNSGNAKVQTKDTGSTGEMFMGFGSGHQNHGIYSYGYAPTASTWTANAKWMVYRDDAGNIILNGNATSATGFASAKSIALTGNVTGSATGGNGSNGWSIATTIGSGVVTNAMLAGSIANGKLVNSKVTIAGNDVSLGGSLAAATLKTSLGLNSAMHYIGKATVAITDGSTTDPKIGGNATTLVSGDVVIDSSDSREYVWNGSQWELLGGDSSYKVTQTAVTDAAYSGSDTATTFVSAVTQNTNGEITVTKRKLPTYNNYSHPTGDGNKHVPANGTSNNGKFLQATATAGTYQWASLPTASTTGAGIIQIGTAATNAAAGNHTHTTSLSQTGTATINLAANTTYTLTAGGTSVVFKTPADTTYTFDGTYNASTNKAATVSTVTNAINALDGNLNSTTPGAGKTLTAFSQTDGKVSATFGNISITKSQVSDFPTTMTPTSHTHGNITNAGELSTASRAVVTDANKKITVADLSVSDPSASGSGITYIATISQNSQGKISATKSTVRDASASQSGVVSTAAQSFAGLKTFNGGITAGTSSAASSSSHSLWTTGITVHDTRYDSITVTSLSKAANLFFSNKEMPNTNWWAGVHIAGWTGDYSAWELVGPSHNADQRTTPLYIRSGRTTGGWGSWRKIYDTSNKPSISDHSVTTPTGTTSRTADVAVNTTTVNSITAVGTLPSLTVTATDVVTGGTTTAIPNISKKTVVTGGTTTNIPNVTAVGSVPSLTYTARSIPNVTAAGTASYANGILTITNTTLGTAIAADDITAWSAGSTPTLGTAIAAYTALTTGDSVTVGTAINAYTALTTSSIGSASGWSAGTLPTKGSNTTVATGIKTQPTFTVTTTTTTLSHTVS